MFADISGFTPLTEAIAAEFGRRRGGEELTAILNRVYGALIDEIHRFRGSVIGFSGDAITCWFDDDVGARAVTCGHYLQDAMRRLDVGALVGTRRELSIKVAIATGVARRLLVGDPDVQVLDVLAGELVDRLALADEFARRGEVIVDAACVAALGARAEIVRGDGRVFSITPLTNPAPASPWPSLPHDALTPEQLRPWLLPAVWNQLQYGQGEYLAELRPAVPLFLRFGGFDFDGDREAGARLDAYVRWTQQVLQRYEGALIQLTTGDKGNYFYAVFGAPVAHENDVERALACAHALRSPPRSLRSLRNVQIGISRGSLRTGAYGGRGRKTYGALGDETNIAARLMSQAKPSQVLVTGQIATSGAGYLFESLGRVTLKGKRASIPVYALGDREFRRRRHAHASTLIGRESERARLRAAVDRLRDGHGGTVVLEGDPGVGKSSLVDDLLLRAATCRDPALTIFEIEADALECSSAFFPWRAVFSQLLDILPGTPRAEVEARVKARLPRRLLQLAPLLSAVVDVDEGDGDVDPRLRGNLRAASLPPYLAQVFAALASAEGRPITLVVEDAHWMDSSSWGLLELVLRERLELLVVITLRPQRNPPPQFLALRGAPLTETIELGPMSQDETAALVRARLGVTSLPSAFVEFLHDKCEGNPFFLEEVARALVEEDLVRVEGDRCVEVELDAFDFPDNIEGLITSRIDNLRPTPQLALKVASVLGRSFRRDTLHDVLPVADAREGLSAALDELGRADLIVSASPAPEDFTFKNAITRDVAYNLMLFEQRRALHRAAGDWCARAHANDLTPVFALLAYHRTRVVEGCEDAALDDVREAVVALAHASRHALASGATPEALAQSNSALELLRRLSDGRERSELELELRSVLGGALVLRYSPTHIDVQRNFDRARQLCVELGQTRQLFESLFGIWYFNFIGAHREAALNFSARLLEIACTSDDLAIRSRAMEARGCTLICDGHYIEGHARMTAAIKLYQDEDSVRSARAQGAIVQSRDPVVIAYDYRAWARLFLGRPDSAMADARRAIELAEEVSHPLAEAQALSFCAQITRLRREVAATETMARRALALCVEHGFQMWTAGNNSARGWVLLERGRLEDARRGLEQTLRVTEELDLGTISTLTRANLIDAYIRLGRHDEAAALIEHAKTVQRVRLSAYLEPEIHRLEGEMWRRRGDLSAAESCFRRALDVAGPRQMLWLELRAAVSLARLLAARGRPGDSAARVASIYDRFEEGLRTRDLAEARSILQTLGVERPDPGLS